MVSSSDLPGLQLFSANDRAALHNHSLPTPFFSLDKGPGSHKCRLTWQLGCGPAVQERL